jgi:hypothetical protein
VINGNKVKTTHNILAAVETEHTKDFVLVCQDEMMFDFDDASKSASSSDMFEGTVEDTDTDDQMDEVSHLEEGTTDSNSVDTLDGMIAKALPTGGSSSR